MTQTITLYSHAQGGNSWKVAMILEELDLPYKHEFMDMAELKKPKYEAINPNGRVPAIIDPNTGITLWESGAIIEYLIDTYDKSNALSYATSPEKYYTKQWLYFQVSGQGPYFGQGAWFNYFHPERLESAIERYKKEMIRVVDVRNRALEGKEWLVGDKCTYADISFIAWDELIEPIHGAEAYAALDIEHKYSNYYQWRKRLVARPAIAKVMAEHAASVAKANEQKK